MFYSIDRSNNMNASYMRFACYLCSRRVSHGRMRMIGGSLRGESFRNRYG